jgi:hypothetical protein
MSNKKKKDRFFDVEVVNVTKRTKKKIKIDSTSSKTSKSK